MNRRPNRLALLISAALFAGTSLFAQSGFIEGSVVSEGGAPLSGMIVAAYNSAGEVQTTNVTSGYGTYLLSVPAATYRVLAYDLAGTWATSFYNDAGSFETSAEITVAASATRSGINFRLRSAVRIHGTVRNSSGTPLPDMVIAAYNIDGTRRGHQKSGARGEYVLTVPVGQYKIAAWDDALVYAPEFYANARSFSTASTLSVASDTFSIDFSLDFGAKVTGKAVADLTTQPLPGIEISAYDVERGERIAHATTRPGGDFVLPLPVGRYKFAAMDPAGKYVGEFFSNVPSFASAASFDLTAGAWQTGIDFALAPQRDPPSATTLFIPAVINTPGAEGSVWRTDVWIYNPSQESLAVDATYLSGTGTNATKTITIAPRGQIEIANILESYFATGGLGALRLTAPRSFAAVSRTFNTPPNATTAGTFGFSIAAMDAAMSLGLAVLPGVAHGSAYRTNVGIMNPHEHKITVRARLFSASGAVVGELSYPLDPLTVRQPSLGEMLPAGTQLTDGYVVLSSQDGSFFSYASVVDNKSNDPTLVLPSADEE